MHFVGRMCQMSDLEPQKVQMLIRTVCHEFGEDLTQSEEPRSSSRRHEDTQPQSPSASRENTSALEQQGSVSGNGDVEDDRGEMDEIEGEVALVAAPAPASVSVSQTAQERPLPAPAPAPQYSQERSSPVSEPMDVPHPHESSSRQRMGTISNRLRSLLRRKKSTLTSLNDSYI